MTPAVSDPLEPGIAHLNVEPACAVAKAIAMRHVRGREQHILRAERTGSAVAIVHALTSEDETDHRLGVRVRGNDVTTRVAGLMELDRSASMDVERRTHERLKRDERRHQSSRPKGAVVRPIDWITAAESTDQPQRWL